MSESEATMSSSRPYMLRALVEWINDNGLTPHLQVDAHAPGVRVPAFAVRGGKVTLNIALRAVAHLQMDNDAISFQARFGGVSHSVYVPMAAIEAIYARENGQGMVFPPEPQAGAAPALAPATADGAAAPQAESATTAPPKKPPHLRVIK
ncbi:MAG: ClpXP protease specificity-enhancing factor [Metallibacterium scheffleri]